MNRKSMYIQTFTGRQVDPFAIKAGDIDIRDIAHSLSNLCRFGGHVKSFYSVAQHSVRVALAAPPEFALEGLLHDAAEAYLVDIPSPIKARLQEYREIEKSVQLAIAVRFDILGRLPDEIHALDKRALVTESAELMYTPLQEVVDYSHRGWLLPKQPAWEPAIARKRFMQHFIRLKRTPD